LASDWSAELLPIQSSRAVSLLYADTVPTSSSSSQQQQDDGASGVLSAPSLAYCLPLLSVVVKSRKDCEQDETLLVKCLDILSTHAAKLRSTEPQDEVSLS